MVPFIKTWQQCEDTVSSTIGGYAIIEPHALCMNKTTTLCHFVYCLYHKNAEWRRTYTEGKVLGTQEGSICWENSDLDKEVML